MTTFKEKRNEIKRKTAEKYGKQTIKADPFKQYMEKQITYKELLDVSGMKRYEVNMKIKALKDGQ